MNQKFNVILENYLIPVLYVLPIIAYFVLLLGPLFTPSKAAEDTYNGDMLITEAIAESTQEPTIKQETVLGSAKKLPVIDIFDAPVEESESTDATESETNGTEQPATKPDETVEPTIEQTEPNRTEVSSYYDIPLSEDLQAYIIELCNARGIDPAIVMAMIYRESGYDAGAIGDSGSSLGLMQIMPQWNGDRMAELGCYDLLDPYQNVAVGIDCLADYYDQSGSIEWALMAYNGGPGYANNKWSNGELSGYVYSVLSYAESIRNN